MKKILLLVLVCIFSMVSIFAATIEAKGFGTTIAEATDNAKENLANQISSIVYTNTYNLSSALAIDAKIKSVDQSSSQTFVASNNVALLGFKTSSKKLATNSYEVTIWIPDTSLSSYISDINEAAKTVNTLLPQYYAEKDTERQKGIIDTILNNLERFNAARYVILQLSPNTNIPVMDTNYDLMIIEYQKLLDSIGDSIKAEVEALFLNMTAEAETKRQELQVKQAQNNLEKHKMDLANREAEAQRLANLSEANAAAAANRILQSNANWEFFRTSSIKGSNNPEVYIDKIESMRKAYWDVDQTYIKHIRNLQNNQKADVAQQRSIIMNAPYKKAEVKGDGSPIAEVLAYRNSEADKKEAEIKAYYQKQIDETEEARITHLLRLGDDIYKEMEILNSSTFILSSTEEKQIIIQIGSYDGEKSSWPVQLQFIISESSSKYNFELTYQMLTGKEKPKVVGSKEWNEYTDEIEILDGIYSNNYKSLYAKIDYSLEGSLESNFYKLNKCTLSVYSSEFKDLNKPIYVVENPIYLSGFLKYPLIPVEASKQYIKNAEEKAERERIAKIEAEEAARLKAIKDAEAEVKRIEDEKIAQEAARLRKIAEDKAFKKENRGKTYGFPAFYFGGSITSIAGTFDYPVYYTPFNAFGITLDLTIPTPIYLSFNTNASFHFNAVYNILSAYQTIGFGKTSFFDYYVGAGVGVDLLNLSIVPSDAQKSFNSFYFVVEGRFSMYSFAFKIDLENPALKEFTFAMKMCPSIYANAD